MILVHLYNKPELVACGTVTILHACLIHLSLTSLPHSHIVPESQWFLNKQCERETALLKSKD